MIAGLVFGIASTVVIPPASAALVPLSKSSLWVGTRLAQMDVRIDETRKP